MPGCSASSDNQSSHNGGEVEKLLSNAFAAIKSQDWEQYKALTITAADLVLKRRGISKFKEKQSYIGSSMKPSEINKQLVQFNRVIKVEVSIKEDMILFDEDSYVSMGKIVNQGNITTLDDIKIPFKTYSLKVKSQSGKTMDDLYPYFVVVHWGNQPRLLKLIFPSIKRK